MHTRYFSAVLLFLILIISSCQKQDELLNAKPQSNLFSVSTLNDCSNLLQNERIFNYRSSPSAGESSTDEYYITTSDWIRVRFVYQNIYVWAQQIYSETDMPDDWSKPYQQVYYANTVLDALKTITIDEKDQNNANRIKATALFYRSYAFYNLLQLYSKQYDSTTAKNDLGIPLRLTSDFNATSTRASIYDCYHQIISDVLSAITWLPQKSQVCTMPSQDASYGFLARISLVMGNYKDAKSYANSALLINDTLFDYNNALPQSVFYYFTDQKQYPLPEDIYHTTMVDDDLSTYFNVENVDTSLYKLYEDNDLRKSRFFTNYNGKLIFTGSYEFKLGYYLYDGIANDELYLIRAESNARLGDAVAARNDLDSLLIKRYKTGTYESSAIIDPKLALNLILMERRKELCFRGARWTDLRRLNREYDYSVTIHRNINGASYTLDPEDDRYVLPIPPSEIKLSGIKQNIR